MDTKQNVVKLVKNRECGKCTICCRHLAIETPEIVKQPNVPCKNLMAKGGCAIYSTWPTVCNEWFCAWRSLPELDDEWRPDKMSVLLEFSRDNFPAPFTGKTGFRFTILDKKKVLSNYKLASFLSKQIKSGVPCILSYGLESGQAPTTAFLNNAMSWVVQNGKKKDITRAILNAIEACEKMPSDMTKIEDGKLVYF
ncbi:MAG: hypothetical protein P8I94_06320 [Emcibacteraceae bacterium]|nr:hypothetical protein [Emcibacteraceae bacterium]